MQKTLEISWYLIFLFITVERLGVLTDKYDQIPKFLLLSIKYLAIIFCFVVVALNRKKHLDIYVLMLLISVGVICSITFLNIDNHLDPSKYQQFFSWLYILLNLFLLNVTTRKIFILIHLANKISLVTLIFGVRAWSQDDRLDFLHLPGRLTGFFGQPNVSSLCAALGIFILWKFKANRTKSDYIIPSTVLILTASLTVLFGILLALTLKIAINFISKYWIFLIMVFIFILSMIFPFIVTSKNSDLSSEKRFTGRVAVWRWSIQKIQDGNFKPGIEFFPDYMSSQSSHIWWFHSHNQFLMDWLTGGFSLAITIHIFLFFMVISSFRSSVKEPAIYAMSVLLVNSIFEVPLFLDKLDARAFLLIALIRMILVQDKIGNDGVKIE